MGHRISSTDGGIPDALPGEGVVLSLPLHDTCHTHTTQAQILVQLVPGVLEHAVLEVDTGLPVVCPSRQGDGIFQGVVLPVELRQVDLDQIAEALVS
jgi:hypothetical protein